MSAQLITNQTSNLAECYMGIWALYDGGKHFNRVQSGSFQTRCYAAAFSIQSGPKWQADVMEKTTRVTPNQVYKMKCRTLSHNQSTVNKVQVITHSSFKFLV